MAEFTEDEMVNRLIEFARDREQTEENLEVECHPEAHFNHYGDRGVVDLLVRNRVSKSEYGRNEHVQDNIYEVKSEVAINAVTGANEIIRQWNKARRFFYKDEDRRIADFANFKLLFIASPETIRHVVANVDMYSSSEDNDLCTEPERALSNVVFDHPKKEPEIHAAVKSGDVTMQIGSGLYELEYLSTVDGGVKEIVEKAAYSSQFFTPSGEFLHIAVNGMVCHRREAHTNTVARKCARRCPSPQACIGSGRLASSSGSASRRTSSDGSSTTATRTPTNSGIRQ